MDVLQSSIVLNDMAVVIAAFAGALTVMAIILYVSGKIGNVVTVLIIGIMLGYAVSAVVGVLQFFSGAEELHAYVLWGLGSFAKNSLARSEIILLATALLIVPVFYVIPPLNAMLLGENYARSLGFSLKKYNTLILLIAGLLIALGTAFTGPVAFLGLAVPHLARAWFNTSDHKTLIPATLLIGANLALLCNLIARLPGFDTSLPINAVTSMIGAPVVIWVIIKRSKLKVA
jgi:iron complex transport system permease protein